MITKIKFKLNEKILNHSRAIYGPLDFLGDVGGLTDALKAIGQAIIFLISLVTGSKLDQHILSQVFKQNHP